MNETYTVINPTTGDVLVDSGEEPGISPSGDGTQEIQSVVNAEDLGESARDEFGSHEAKRESIVDRDLGLGDVRERSSLGRYACPCCGQGARRVMRVRVAGGHMNQARWVALCAVCAASMLARIPGTIVGGMVRPSRRKRLNRVRAGAQNVHGFRPRPDEQFRRAG